MYVIESGFWPRRPTLCRIFVVSRMARRTKQDAQATRSALLDAAERVFELRGVSRTSLADIAQAAGVTRGALYWHFRDKADLFNAMMERITLPLGSGAEVLQGCPGDVLDEWCAQLRHALHRIARDEQTQRVLRIAMQKVEHAQDLAPAIERHVRAHRMNAEAGRQVLERAARARGVRLPAPAAQLAQGLHAMVHGLIYSWLLDESFDLEATGAASVAAFLRGIGLGGSPASAAPPRDRR